MLYGAAKFSCEVDLAILADSRNLARLSKGLDDLKAEVIAVRPLDPNHLRRGYALHFRCLHPEGSRVRIDVMSRIRGVEAFSRLWARRTTIVLPARLAWVRQGMRKGTASCRAPKALISAAACWPAVAFGLMKFGMDPTHGAATWLALDELVHVGKHIAWDNGQIQVRE